MHQRNDLAAEVLKVGNEVVEVHLDAVTACPLEANEPIDDLLRRADQVDVAANHPLVTCRLLPGRLVAAGKRGMEVVGGNRILMIENGLILGPRLLLGIAADYVRIDDCADGAPLFLDRKSTRLNSSH